MGSRAVYNAWKPVRVYVSDKGGGGGEQITEGASVRGVRRRGGDVRDR